MCPDAMEGAADHAPAAVIEQAAGAPQHLLAGAAGKGEQQNRFRGNALLDQMGKAIDQGSRLAAAGPGDDQYRSQGGGHRLVLGFVELLKCYNGRRRRRGLGRGWKCHGRHFTTGVGWWQQRLTNSPALV
jgi:hypothetical protein